VSRGDLHVGSRIIGRPAKPAELVDRKCTSRKAQDRTEHVLFLRELHTPVTDDSNPPESNRKKGQVR
jgi:hypothetical protein